MKKINPPAKDFPVEKASSKPGECTLAWNIPLPNLNEVAEIAC